MYKETTFNFYPVNHFEQIQESIRKGDLATAKELLLDENSSVRVDNVDKYLDEEKAFLKVIDESHRLNAEGDDGIITARQALLCGILYGYKQDQSEDGFHADVWFNPFNRDVIVDWALSFYPGDSTDIEKIFEVALVQGSLFEVHPGVFDQPQYYFSYEPKFLLELENGEELVQMYKEEFRFPVVDEYDSTWLKTGICKGQGSMGRWPFYTCVGTSCIWFKKGADECVKDLKFNPSLLKAYKERVNS